MTTPTVTELPRRSEATTMDPFNPRQAGVMMPGREPGEAVRDRYVQASGPTAGVQR